MGIKKDFLRESTETIMMLNPDLDKESVEKVVARMMKERFSDPTITMDNNVTGVTEMMKLTELCNWIDQKKPVVSGNATFYVQPDVMRSPTSKMLRSLKRARKSIKKEMFAAKNAGNDDKYQQLDLAQLNAKVIMNAEYGASGAPMAAFYTKYSPAATTLMAQSIITTMAAFFEGFVGDNQKYYNINECIDWMNTIRRKEEEIPNWMVVPSVDETFSRIRSHFIEYDMRNDTLIEQYLSHCSDRELSLIFYTNNFKEFIRRHKKPKDLLNNVFSTLPLYEASENDVPEKFKNRFTKVTEYNKWVSQEMFLDPYNIPPVIKKDMGELIGLLQKYCFVRYLTPDSIVKLNNHKRNSILLVDTDSNVINADIFVQFVLEEIFPEKTFSRSKLYNEMIAVNILASVLDPCVKSILDFYCECRNIKEEERAELTMKNEFMFRVLFLMDKKKRYAASIALREGNIMMPFGTEIKGMDFIKAGVTEEVTNRFTKMLEEHILFADEIELHELMKDLKDFENEIYKDLRSGGVRFLKPQGYKSESAYKNPWSQQVFKATAIWNEIYPLQKIYSLDRIKLIKLTVTGPADLKSIEEKYPEDYKTIMEKIFSSKNSNIASAGMKVIAIPNTMQKIPDWIVELIDYDVIISDVIGSFRSVLQALRIEEINIKTPNGKANIVSSLISV